MMPLKIRVYDSYNRNSLMSRHGISQSENTSLDAEQDFQKLMEICNSYGLDEEETKQLMDEFKRGALFELDRNKDQDRSGDSSQDMDSLDQSQTDCRKIGELDQYSFQLQRNLKGQGQVHSGIQIHHGIQPTQTHLQTHAQNHGEQGQFQLLIHQLKRQNQELRFRLQKQTDQKQEIRKAWTKQSENVSGLKDLLTELVKTIKQKQKDHNLLLQKYTQLVSTIIKSDQLDTIGLRELPLPASNRSSTGNLTKSALQSFQKQNNISGRNKIDVKKYKGMIQSIRKGMI